MIYLIWFLIDILQLYIEIWIYNKTLVLFHIQYPWYLIKAFDLLPMLYIWFWNVDVSAHIYYAIHIWNEQSFFKKFIFLHSSRKEIINYMSLLGKMGFIFISNSSITTYTCHIDRYVMKIYFTFNFYIGN